MLPAAVTFDSKSAVVPGVAGATEGDVAVDGDVAVEGALDGADDGAVEGACDTDG